MSHKRATSVLFNKLGKIYIFSSAAISLLICILIFTTLLLNTKEVYSRGLFFTLEWNPSKELFGIWPMIFGSITVTFIALTLAVPIALFTSIYTAEFLSPRYRFFVKSLLELLAGIPSIIYGLIGVAFFSLWIENVFDLESGRTILCAGLILAIMILPTIITLSDDAFSHIPQKYREASLGLGLYRYEMIFSCLWPLAKNNVIGATLLALGRALGETMAVMLVIGSLDKIPTPFYNWLTSGQTITSKLGREISETPFGSLHFQALIFMALILFLIVLVLILLSQYFSRHSERLYE